MSLRTIEVKAALTCEEFVAFKAMVESKGISQSSFVRMYIKESIARHCAEQMNSAEDREPSGNWTDNVQPFDFSFANR